MPRPWRKQQDNKAKLRQVSYGYKDGGDQTARRVPWNKTLDTIEVAFPAPIVKVTKREIFRKISKTYDLLGLVEYREEILSIDPHAFGDAGSKDNSAAVYAVTQKSSGITQGLVTSKSRLAKKGLTTPRLELVAGHMATNLVDNVKEALQGFPIRSVYGWLDSSVALHRRSRTRITSVGDTSGRRTTLPISEAEVVSYLRQQTCAGVDLYG